MIAENSSINLIKDRSAIPEYIQPVQSQFRNFSLLALIVAVVAGSALLLVYGSVRVRYQLLVSQKNKLTRELDTLKPKEVMFAAIKSRIGVIDKAVSSTRPVSQIVNTSTGIVTPPNLMEINYDEKDQVTLTLKASSLEDMLNISGALVDLSDRKVIKKPVLESLSVNKDGVKASIQFQEVWAASQ